jgi:hypothetical protein
MLCANMCMRTDMRPFGRRGLPPRAPGAHSYCAPLTNGLALMSDADIDGGVRLPTTTGGDPHGRADLRCCPGQMFGSLLAAIGSRLRGRLRILLRRGGDAHAHLRQAASLASVAWLGLWGALLLPGTAATDPEFESTEQKALDLRGAERGIEVTSRRRSRLSRKASPCSSSSMTAGSPPPGASSGSEGTTPTDRNDATPALTSGR